jgi:dienelactone hydrolase
MKLVLCALGASWTLAGAAQVDDLSGGQTGRVEFASTNPAHRFAVIRGRLGQPVAVHGDLLMPKNTVNKVPAVVFSHGSEGINDTTLNVWAKPLVDAGYAVFVVDSFKPRNEEKVTGATKQLTWNTTFNLSDALHALKLLATHPQIDPNRIFHIGWSRGGQVVLDAAWPTYQQHIVPASVKWAGSVAIYPGCNMRYRVDHHSALPSPMVLLIGEKDDLTLPKPCIEYVDELAAAGNKVSYKVYPGAYHVFDRLNQPWRQYKEGNFNLCSMDIRMPSGAQDPMFGPARDKYSGQTLTTVKEWDAYWPKCQQATYVTAESNPKARDQAVKDVLAFLAAPQ